MKKILSLFFFFMLIGSLSLAETINLQDGQSITGKVLQQDEQSIKVDLNGVERTYYADEIKDIDGKPFARESKSTVEQTTKRMAVGADNPADKRALILKFIDVFGTRKVMAQNFDTMIDSIAQQKPEEAQKIRDRVEVDEIIERLIPLYDKHFTASELKTYIDFYSSASGQKLITNISLVMQESVEVSANYLKEKFPELNEEE